MLSLLTTLLLGAGASWAQACEADALARQIEQGSPHETAALFVTLAGCDQEAARTIMPQAFARMMMTDDASLAAEAAIELGGGEIVREWISARFADERVAVLRGLGCSCAHNPAVVAFLVESDEALGDRFWDDRWHRALAHCRDNAVKVFLTQQLQDPAVQTHPTHFDSALDLLTEYAGVDAVPWLKVLMLAVPEPNQVALVRAFLGAARSGGDAEPEAAARATAALVELAPDLSQAAVGQARMVIQSLGEQQAADSLVCAYYKDRVQPSGQLLWGAVVVETARCKNGQLRVEVHHAPVVDSCRRWPDQLPAAVLETLGPDWTGRLAERCKGTSTHEHLLPPQPFADQAAYETWRDETLQQVRARPAKRVDVVERGVTTLP